MIISGVQKFTMLDFPGRVACIVYTAGCNFRCGYCHNSEFVLPEKIKELSKAFISENAFFRFLEERQGLLDGVVVSGGEPTLQVGLLDFMKKIKDMGYAVKLDTNGNRPDILREAIDRGVVDYVAIDVKSSNANYERLVGRACSGDNVQESLDILREDRVDYELRSTLVREVHSTDILNGMAIMISGMKRLYLQSFRSNNTLDPLFEGYHSFSPSEMDLIADFFRGYVDSVAVRR